MAVLDIIDEGGVQRTDAATSAQRVFIVSTTGAAENKLISALSDPAVPAHRTAHPTLPGMYLTETLVEPIPGENDAAKVILRYTAEDDPLTAYTEWSFEGFWYRSFRDSAGAFLETQAETAAGVFSPVQRHSNWIRGFSGQAAVTILRAPQGLTKGLQDSFANRVNSTSFSGYSPGTVLCQGFENVSNNDGTDRITCHYMVTPSNRPDGWLTTVRHVNQGFWQVGLDITISERTYSVYPLVDFATMSPAFPIT